MIVLDASAVLAFLMVEPGQEKVAKVIDGSAMSAVNLGETLTRMEREGRPASDIRAVLESTGVVFFPFDVDQAEAAAVLWHVGRPFGLSLGDRSCLALATALGAPVMTAERRWAGLPLGLQIEVIR
jgi:ribonuclease VapC